MSAPDAEETERFRASIARRLGLYVDDHRLGPLVEILGRRSALHAGGINFYLAALESGEAHAEWRVLARELTITETYFFRNIAQFGAFSEVALPALLQSSAPPRRLRILSAGCASGEEAYSLAIALREQSHLLANTETSILALDINPGVLERAARGLYSLWSLRETPDAIKARWFKRTGDDFALSDSIRAMVRFDERNLTEDDPSFWQPGSFDVVFCRNVIMYFAPETGRNVVGRFSRSLIPGGFLFLGHAETLRGLSHDFHLCHTHDTFYYQRRGESELARPAQQPPLFSRTPRYEPLTASVDKFSWVDTIRISSERIQTLARPTSPTQPSSAVGGEVTKPRPALALPAGGALIVEMVRQERFLEAKALLDALPAEVAQDPDVLLLRAVLLTHGGDPKMAETLCAQLLDMDETNAGARYLIALCKEHLGDPQGALEQDQIAVYLDPSFAMPRLHLGLLARRGGNTHAARREFVQALALLQREDASRLLLFGGGFGRDALIALCRAELSRCGQQP